MALKTLVKVGGITNLSDARYCAGMGVDFLGFSFIEGRPGSIPAKTFQEIRGWISGPKIVAEVYGIGSRAELEQILTDTHPDLLEMSVRELKLLGEELTLPYILNLESAGEVPGSAKPLYLLVQSHTEGVMSGYNSDFEVLVQIQSAEQLGEVLDKTGVSGISLSGGSEIRPGLKDYDALSQILEALDED